MFHKAQPQSGRAFRAHDATKGHQDVQNRDAGNLALTHAADGRHRPSFQGVPDGGRSHERGSADGQKY